VGVGLGSYYLTLWARAWRDTVEFLKSQGVLLGLVGVILTAAFTWYDSAGVGEQFSPHIPVYAAIRATAVLTLVTLLVNLFIARWRLHQAQATYVEATILKHRAAVEAEFPIRLMLPSEPARAVEEGGRRP
jgi:hypothetical protein